MAEDGPISKENVDAARAAVRTGKRALELWAEGDTDGEDEETVVRSLVDAIEGLLAGVVSIEELQSPTWRLLYPEGDSFLFVNDWGETARLPACVAVATARGDHLAWRTTVAAGIVEFQLADGTKGEAPLTLIKALAPRRWPSRVQVPEVGP